MKIDYKLIELIGIVIGLFTISNYFWKITKFLGSKSKSVDARIHALYDVLKIQQLRITDITDYLSLPSTARGDLTVRKSLQKLEDNAFGDYENENTGFD